MATLLYGGVQGGTGTLETLLKSGIKNAIRITVPPAPAAASYRRCEMGAFPPAYALSLPVGLRREHVAKLQELDEGDVVTINFDRAGLCKRDPDPTSSCHFELHITLKIRRWVSGTRFP